MTGKFQCSECGENSVIFTYYNTEMDCATSVDIFNHEWGYGKEDHIERVDCSNCHNIIHMEEN